MSKNIGLFNISESAGLDDILDLNIYAEDGSNEFNDIDDLLSINIFNEDQNITIPDGGLKEGYLGGYKELSISVPEGDKETPSSKPYDNASISVPGKINITADVYNDAFAKLKRSFKEGIEVMELIENAVIVEKSADEMQEEYTESVMWEALYESYIDGPMFEAVDKSNKGEIKAIIKKNRNAIYSFMKDESVTFYKPSYFLRTLVGLGLLVGGLTTYASGVTGGINAAKAAYAAGGSMVAAASGDAATAAGGYLAASAGASNLNSLNVAWRKYIWQIVGVVHVNPNRISKLMTSLNDKFKEELGEYKLIPVKTSKSFYDALKTKFGWNNDLAVYTIIIDDEMPAEFKAIEKIEVSTKDLKKGAPKEEKDPKESKKNKEEKE